MGYLGLRSLLDWWVIFLDPHQFFGRACWSSLDFSSVRSARGDVIGRGFSNDGVQGLIIVEDAREGC